MHPSDLTEIIEKANQVVSKACSINHHEGKKGGWLCIAQHDGSVEAIVKIGEVLDKWEEERYFKFSKEKATILASNPKHVSSWQNLSHEKFGGAIRVRDYILSFAGLSPQWDEACVLAIGHNNRRHLIKSEQVEEIRKISDNPHVSRLIAATIDKSQKN